METPSTVRRERPTMRSGRGRGSPWCRREAADELTDGAGLGAYGAEASLPTEPHTRASRSAPARGARVASRAVEKPFDVIVGLMRTRTVRSADRCIRSSRPRLRVSSSSWSSPRPHVLQGHRRPDPDPLTVTDHDPYPSPQLRYGALSRRLPGPTDWCSWFGDGQGWRRGLVRRRRVPAPRGGLDCGPPSQRTDAPSRPRPHCSAPTCPTSL